MPEAPAVAPPAEAPVQPKPETQQGPKLEAESAANAVEQQQETAIAKILGEGRETPEETMQDFVAKGIDDAELDKFQAESAEAIAKDLQAAHARGEISDQKFNEQMAGLQSEHTTLQSESSQSTTSPTDTSEGTEPSSDSATDATNQHPRSGAARSFQRMFGPLNNLMRRPHETSGAQPSTESAAQKNAAGIETPQTGQETREATSTTEQSQLTDAKRLQAETQAQNELNAMKERRDKGEITADEFEAAKTNYQQTMAELSSRTGVAVTSDKYLVDERGVYLPDNQTLNDRWKEENNRSKNPESKSHRQELVGQGQDVDHNVPERNATKDESTEKPTANEKLTTEQKDTKDLLEAGVNLAKLGVDSSTPEGQQVLAEYAKNPEACKEIIDALVSVKNAAGEKALPATAKAMEDALKQQQEAAESTGDTAESNRLKMLLAILAAILLTLTVGPAAGAIAGGAGLAAAFKK